MEPLLPITYLGPVHFYSKLAAAPRVTLEIQDHYIKQTYRNRCNILAANGPIPLVIPVEKGRQPKICTRDVKIAYHLDWQKNHWRSITSAYKNSPFFEYYADDLLPFYQKKWDYLVDYVVEIQQTMLDLIELDTQVILSDVYIEKDQEGYNDFRERIHPKKPFENDPDFNPTPYWQVFKEKFGFVPNLSIIDLLFNKGPETLDILESCSVI